MTRGRSSGNLTRLVILATMLQALPLSAVPAAAEQPVAVAVTVTETGGLSPETRAAIQATADLLGVETAIHHTGTIRLLGVSRDGVDIQRPPSGFGYPLATSALDLVRARPLIEPGLAAVLRRGEAVMSEFSAALRGAETGDMIELEGWDGEVAEYRIGGILPDEQTGWFELVLSVEKAAELSLDRPAIGVAWGGDPDRIQATLRRFVGAGPISVRLPDEPRPETDLPLATVLVKQRFGEFAYRPAGGDKIQIDQTWLDANIVEVELPVLGQFKCHRKVVPYLRAAVAELIVTGAIEEIDPNDFQLAGGCFNSRMIRGGDKGFAISRHAWGIAIDFNPSTNPYGGPVALDNRVGETFRRWGFAWGATWPYPDGMHFEWRRPSVPEWTPLSTPTACSSGLLVYRDADNAMPPWEVYSRSGPCGSSTGGQS